MEKALNNYRYENQIQFNIEEVKTALKNVLNLNPTRFLHNANDLNDIMLTYRFGEIKCSYVVTLQKIDDTNTKIVISCSERYGFPLSVASLESYVTEFLNILTAKLSGQSDTEVMQVMNNNNSDSNLANTTSCMSLIIIVITIISIIMIFAL